MNGQKRLYWTMKNFTVVWLLSCHAQNSRYIYIYAYISYWRLYIPLCVCVYVCICTCRHLKQVEELGVWSWAHVEKERKNV